MLRFIRSFFGFILFRLTPTLVIAAIVWSGYQVAQAVVRQLDERTTIEARSETFTGTATGIAESAPTITPTPTLTFTATTPTATNTPEPTVTDTASPTATDKPSPTATNTPTATPSPTGEPTDEPTATDTEVSANLGEDNNGDLEQFGATNTPRPVIFATNTPVGAADDSASGEAVPDTPIPPSATPLPTATIPPPTMTPAPTETIAPQPEATRPLPTVFLPQSVEEGRTLNGTAVPTSVPLVPREGRDLVNILLLGGDDELSNDGFARTDTIIVVSINRDENTVSMLSIPRDLFVYIPTTNGLMERINIVYDFGEVNGYTGGGFGLMRQTILYNFGINVHYYAKVNFSGFTDLIDALGGVEIAVDCAYQDYALIGAEVPEDADAVGDEGLYTLDIGYYEMSGAQALWYARTRRNSWDFDRGRRQQQLLRAIWRESLGSLSLTNAPQLWNELNSIVETDMQLEDFIGLLPIAINLDVSRIRSYTMVRDVHTRAWQPPNGSFVQLPVYEGMRPLIEEFYRPPIDSQILIEGATIAVYNGTEHADWDRVAAERLAWEGFRAASMGETDATEINETMLIDYTGQQKGSSTLEIAQALNVRRDNIIVDPDPNRTVDFEVILGDNYNSCNVGGVLPVDEVTDEGE